MKLGGALRFTYFVSDHSDDLENRYGDTGLDLFRLNADGNFGKLFLCAEYRFYRYMNTIHHGYAGYHLSDNSQIQGGITQVPFGLLSYAAHNFWFGVPYYLGLADDYDSGIKYQYANDGWDWHLAFFKNEELGNAGDLERYSYDPVTLTNTGGTLFPVQLIRKPTRSMHVWPIRSTVIPAERTNWDCPPRADNCTMSTPARMAITGPWPPI